MTLERQAIQSLQIDTISSPDAIQQFSALLDSCFGVPQGSKFFNDFPIWDPEYGLHQVLRIGVFQQQKLVSAAAVRLAQMKVSPQNSITVAVVGAVATHPDWRKSGLASNTVSLGTQWAKERGAAIAFVWGSEYSLYHRLGYELCGQQARVPLTFLGGVSATPVEVHRGWNSSLFSILKERPGGFTLGDEDRAWYEAHKNVEWFYTGASDRPSAYVGLGRGIDLKGIIHEWGGEPSALFDLLRSIRIVSPDVNLLGAPEHFKQMGIPFTAEQIEFVSMAKVLDPLPLLAGIRPELPSAANFKNGRWDISLGLESFTHLSDHELVKKVLGPFSAKQSAGAGVLPWSFWIWGLDAA
jgi:GNAT superfamily N-acetyltransferase